MTSTTVRRLVGAAMLALVVVLAPMPAGAADDVSWSIRPQDPADAVIAVRAEPAARVEYGLVVVNEGDGPLELEVTTSDTRVDADGALEVTDTRTAAGAWVSVPSTGISIEAGEQRTIPVVVVVPPEAAPGEYVAAVVTAAPAAPGVVAVERRLALRVLVTVAEPGSGSAVPLVAGAGLVVGLVLAAVLVGRTIRSRGRSGVLDETGTIPHGEPM
ncbi:hypothetical protein [Cellulomonas composti]|uniref:Alpha-galactosidase NEW3 domain-containing protein n=1 Tax=Cellulomonas composti TaxID=266130 RepID=A0A511JD34_9CELL|nr:hypothetical protein [Cellulomonas composti]GEL95623.1 hypothetical protein CCO02nite_22810 [Cellulomonas composti]